ncbi:MAG: FHA domain-containing protein [Bacteroidota bacterium]
MFDLFKNRPTDVKEIRNALLQLIKEQLQKAEGGEGANIRALYLFFTCSDSDRYLYESAIYFDDPDRFKNEEVQRIADDFAINLPAAWSLKISFEDEPPAEAIRAKNIDVALLVSTFKNPVLYKQVTAYINVLNGETEKKQYVLDSSGGKINIGRGTGVQTADGFFRKNNIAFTDADHPGNRAVSRQHAHIQWDAVTGSFFLYADEGGIPPSNKVKIRTQGEAPVKLLSTEIGHRLQGGDQVMLGDSALLEFSLTPE